MQYIAATQLRTQTPQLIESLKQGETVNLLYRSQLLGEIRPIKKRPPIKKKTLAETREFFRNFVSGNKKLSHKEIDSIYRKRLMEKYG